MPSSISRQAKDVIQKLIVTVHRSAAVAWLRVDAPRIIDVVSPDLPVLEIHENLLESVFLTENGSLLHLEFQTHPVPSLDRFLAYTTALVLRHHRPIQTVVVNLFAQRDLRTTDDWGSLQYRVQHVFIGDRDADATLSRLRAQGPEAWDLEDDLDLAFLPFMRSTQSQQVLLEQAVTLAANPLLPKAHRQYASALVGGMTVAFIPPEVLKSLKEVVRMTNDFIREIEQEATERGLEQGRLEGRLEGQRLNLLRLIETRFGSLAPQQVEQVLQWSSEVIERKLPLLFTVTSVDEMFE